MSGNQSSPSKAARHYWKAALPALALASILAGGVANAATDNAAQPKAEIPAQLDFKSCAKPVYPAASIAKKDVGTVTVAFMVEADGKVSGSMVQKTSGHAELDEAARSALTLCQFKPGKTKGKAIKSWAHVQYVWTLD